MGYFLVSLGFSKRAFVRVVLAGAALSFGSASCSSSEESVVSGSSGKAGSGATLGAAGAGMAGRDAAGGVSGGGASGGGSGGSATAGADGSAEASGGETSEAGPDVVVVDASFEQESGPVGDAGCSAGSKQCGTQCVSVDDPAFGCAAASCQPCAIPFARAKCGASGCVLGACDAGRADCNGEGSDGCESELAIDEQHCGACGNACRLPRATAECTAGACAVLSCDQGFGNCDGNGPNGCESNLAKDPAHCGSCPRACQPTPGAAAVCNNGTCGEKACPPGLMDCDGNSANGCETNLSNDPQNCGFCGNACGNLPNATAGCVAGQCRAQGCIGGYLDCDGNGANGCETDPQVNSLHCGACGRDCERAGTSSVRCQAGACHAICDTAGDCLHPTAPAADDGCETPTASDPQNCGACGNVCVVPSGTAGCTAGRCSISDCPGSTGDCDGDVANGCETNLLTHANHCGACGRGCSSTGVVSRVCSNGTCNSGCATGLTNCSKPAAPAPDDGCETQSVDDPQNCGGCGRVCSGEHVLSRACSAGRCSSSCELGFGNCVQPASPLADDGCETDVATSSSDCGGCDNDCTRQGGGGSGLKCAAPTASSCGCAGNDGRCRLSGAGGTCDAASGRCICGTVSCASGEACTRVGGADQCSCNAGSACAAGQVCCQTPAGCTDLATDARSCGACGRACPAGFSCVSSSCSCSGDASCNAGSSGSCNAQSGVCSCAGTPCAPGQRCLASGACG